MSEEMAKVKSFCSLIGGQARQPPSCLCDARLDLGGLVQFPGLLPHRPRLSFVACCLFEQRESPKRIRQIERNGPRVCPVDLERFRIAGLGHIQSTRPAMKVADMANGVRDPLGISYSAAQRQCFLIMAEGDVGPVQVPLNLA